jgi:hypothetical protein
MRAAYSTQLIGPNKAESLRLPGTLHHTHDVRVFLCALDVLKCTRGKGVVEVTRSLQVTKQSERNQGRWVPSAWRANRTDCQCRIDNPPFGEITPDIDTDRCSQVRDATQSRLDGRSAVRSLDGHSHYSGDYHTTHWTVPLLQGQACQNSSMHCSQRTI